ncbi:hypothetical protein M413DRAFT_449772 [Hebeloma cylindrosporum]|uniref:Uncharacterized protein n=1 Tax=Hebeloma cylindrosporum TaxID=76867 RepID=A0A0C2Y2Q9_HEBCY|nr:hypothetical protein M413DRAFT_449772 [Hebeloma cylindrosporum h7]
MTQTSERRLPCTRQTGRSLKFRCQFESSSDIGGNGPAIRCTVLSKTVGTRCVPAANPHFHATVGFREASPEPNA